MKVEFHPAAAAEVVETTAYYDQKVTGLGNAFLSEPERITEMLRNQPRIGKEIEKGFRRIVLAKFPYVLIYNVESDGILIVAVAHQRRRPGYWKDRSYR